MTVNKFLRYLLVSLFCFAGSTAFAQTQIFLDEFNGTSLSLVSTRTPDTGTGYTLVLNGNGSGDFEIVSSVRARTNQGVENSTILLTFEPAPTSPNYDVGFSLNAWPTSATDDPAGVVARYQDASNYYAVVIYNSVAGTSNCFLTKMVAGTPTDLASGTVTLSTGVAYELRVSGSTISFYGDTTEILTATDSSITAAGKGGMFSGSMRGQASDDTRNAWQFERVYVDEYAVASSRRIWILQ